MADSLDSEERSRLYSFKVEDHEVDEEDQMSRSRPRWRKSSPTGLRKMIPFPRLAQLLRNPTVLWCTLVILVLLGVGREVYHYHSSIGLSHVKASDLPESSAAPIPSPSPRPRPEHVQVTTPPLRADQVPSQIRHARPGDSHNAQNVAYVSMFTETVMLNEDKEYDYNDDHYYIAMRMLTYQLLHAEETRTTRSIPLIIMVTPDVAQHKRDQLEKDGAIIWPIEMITEGLEWMKTEMGRADWADQLSKLRVFELIQYDRVLYVDNDMVLMRPLDGIFDADVYNNTAVQSLSNTNETHGDEAPMPEKYLVAGSPETMEAYTYPPGPEHSTAGTNYLNGGFFMLKPDMQLAEYYHSVARIPHRFVAIWMEQGLLWYAHRQTGNMPSLILPTTWNNLVVNREAIAGKVASIHDKWWKPRAHYRKVQKYLMAIRWRMEAYYELLDNYQHSSFNGTKELLGVDLTVVV